VSTSIEALEPPNLRIASVRHLHYSSLSAEKLQNDMMGVIVVKNI
jgi:hypothetical protein